MRTAQASLVNVKMVGNGQILKLEPTGLAVGPGHPEALGLSHLLGSAQSEGAWQEPSQLARPWGRCSDGGPPGTLGTRKRRPCPWRKWQAAVEAGAAKVRPMLLHPRVCQAPPEPWGQDQGGRNGQVWEPLAQESSLWGRGQGAEV